MKEPGTVANPDRFLDTVVSAKGRLEPKHLAAAHLLTQYLKHPAGSSGGLTGSYKERVDCSSTTNQSRAKAFPRQSQYDDLINAMRREERDLFDYLLFGQGAKAGEKIDLCTYGKKKSGYSSGDHCRAFATGQLRAMLDGVADSLIRQRVMPAEMAA